MRRQWLADCKGERRGRYPKEGAILRPTEGLSPTEKFAIRSYTAPRMAVHYLIVYMPPCRRSIGAASIKNMIWRRRLRHTTTLLLKSARCRSMGCGRDSLNTIVCLVSPQVTYTSVRYVTCRLMKEAAFLLWRTCLGGSPIGRKHYVAPRIRGLTPSTSRRLKTEAGEGDDECRREGRLAQSDIDMLAVPSGLNGQEFVKCGSTPNCLLSLSPSL